MKIKKIAAILLVLLLSCAAFADSFDDFDDFCFDDLSTDSSVFIGGQVSTDLRYYWNDDDNSVEFIPSAKVSLSHDTDKVCCKVVFDVNQDKWENSKLDLIEELSIKGFFGNFNIETGKLCVVWGKGDKLHVLDNFNADDYTNFIIPEYVDRRISVPMIRASYSVPTNSNITVEGIYSPFIAKDRFNTSGALVPTASSQLTQLITSLVATPDNMANLIKLARVSGINDNPDVLYPNLYRLKYSQAGLRITGTFDRLDWGVSYYNGYYKQPSLNALKLAAWSEDITKKADFLEFDRKQTFGLEGATTLWHFNLRGEAAFNLSEDVQGTDPWTKNSSFQWVVGFDIDLPLWNMNFNLQEAGTFVLDGKKCDDNTMLYYATLGAKDVDYSSNGYLENMLVANLSASFNHDKFKPEISALWCIEKKDVVLLPKLSYDLTPELNLNVQLLHVYSKDSNSKFSGFDKNDFVQLGTKYKF